MRNTSKYRRGQVRQQCIPEEINRYVRDLPPEDRESLFEVIKILHDEGLITVLEDEPMTTVDENMLPYLE